MRLHRFYINRPIGYEHERITDERLIHQWRDVFRYNVGTEMIVFDGSGKEFDVVIERLTRVEAILKIFQEREGSMPKRKIVLCQSLVKKDKMEWIIEKATELGVAKIVPIVSERSEKKSLNMERAEKIAIEASEQSGRANLPELLEPVDLTTGLLYEIKKRGFEIIAFDPSGESLKLPPEIFSSTRLQEQSPAPDGAGQSISENISQGLAVFIGPEGGWTDKELNLLADGGATIYSLGSLTLRAETAAVAALAKISI